MPWSKPLPISTPEVQPTGFLFHYRQERLLYTETLYHCIMRLSITQNIVRSILEICAIGSGDARKETAFTQFCAEHASTHSHTRLYLLDISHMLLTEGYLSLIHI